MTQLVLSLMQQIQCLCFVLFVFFLPIVAKILSVSPDVQRLPIFPPSKLLNFSLLPVVFEFRQASKGLSERKQKLEEGWRFLSVGMFKANLFPNVFPLMRLLERCTSSPRQISYVDKFGEIFTWILVFKLESSFCCACIRAGWFRLLNTEVDWHLPVFGFDSPHLLLSTGFQRMADVLRFSVCHFVVAPA